MAKVTVIATGKKYGTRHMTAGETMSVRPAEARVMKALGLAKDSPPAKPRAAKPVNVPSAVKAELPLHPLDGDGDGHPGGSLPAEQRGDGVDFLRDEYARLYDRRPDMRWGEQRLHDEVAAAAKPEG